MRSVLLMWGAFPFITGGAAFEELEHKVGGRWKDHEIIGRRLVGQYTGPARESVRIKGCYFPQHQSMGGAAIITGMQRASSAGEVFPLVSGAGQMFGTFRLEEMTRSESFILAGGAPGKIAYELMFVQQEDMGGSIWSLWP